MLTSGGGRGPGGFFGNVTPVSILYIYIWTGAIGGIEHKHAMNEMRVVGTRKSSCMTVVYSCCAITGKIKQVKDGELFF